MMFKFGDFVKGNTNHINSKRMDDVGVVTKAAHEFGDYWILWQSDGEEHYAPYYELDLVKAAE